MLTHILKTRFVLFAVLAALVTTLLTPLASYASVTGTRNTTIGLGAATVYLLMKGKTGAALVTGAGTYYAYKKYQDAKDEEDRRDRWRSRYDRDRHRSRR